MTRSKLTNSIEGNIKSLAFGLALAIVFAGCGEARVVSKHKPVPKPIAATVNAPDLRYPAGPAASIPPIELPANKRFLLAGQITGVAEFERKMGPALLALHPVNDATNLRQTNYAAARLEIEFLTDDTLKYTATIEPVNRTGPMEIWLHLNSKAPVIAPAHMKP